MDAHTQRVQCVLFQLVLSSNFSQSPFGFVLIVRDAGYRTRILMQCVDVVAHTCVTIVLEQKVARCRPRVCSCVSSEDESMVETLSGWLLLSFGAMLKLLRGQEKQNRSK